MHITKLRWDAFNVAHIDRHHVKPHEVEEACQRDHVTRETHHNRILLTGLTLQGRLLSIVLDQEDKTEYYVVTARDASRKERQFYRDMKGGERAA